MLQIAICDDEQNQLSATEAVLQEYSKMHPELNMRIHSFLSGAALLESLRTIGSFDIYILDVLLTNENGIDLGLNIRRTDNHGHIFYLTSSPDYAIDSYLTKASQYLLKPLNRSALFAALDDTAATWLWERQAFVTLKTKSGLQRVSIRDVVYGELVGHYVQYHLLDGTVLEGTSVRTSFREAVAPLLAHDRFILCSTSFFVNLSYVKMIDSEGLKLSGGGIVPLSRSMRTDVTNRWLDYYLKGGINA